MLDIDDQIRRYVEAVAPPVRSDEIRTEPKSVKRLKPALIGVLVVPIGVEAV